MALILADIGHALRQFRMRRGFTLVALLTIALGIGINTLIFSVVSAVLLRSLPFPEPDNLLALYTIQRQHGGERDIFSPGNFLSVQEMNHSFDAVSAIDFTGFDLTMPGEEPRALSSVRVSGDFWRVLGVKPWMGKVFGPAEDRPGQDRVVVLSHGLWKTQFHSDPSIVGRIIQLNSTPFTVLGVMPADFNFPEGISLWAPVAFSEEQRTWRGNIYLPVIARLKKGVALPAALSDLQEIATRLERENPVSNKGVGMTAIPLQESIVGDARKPLIVLAAAVGFVLVIACANLANLLLANASTRTREFAVRKALGASRGRLLQQLLTEALLLAIVGGALGVFLSYWALPVLKQFIPAQIPRVDEITVDANVLMFTLGISVVTGLLFGVIPALSFSRGDVQASLKEGKSTASGHKRRLNGVLIVGQVMLVLVMLTGAGLMIQSFLRLSSVNPGFRAEDLLSFQLQLPALRYDTPEKRRAFYQQLLEELKSIPGVEKVGLATPAPFSAGDDVIDLNYFGEGGTNDAESVANFTRVNPEFFDTMKISFRQGRKFVASDDTSQQQVCIINEALAQKHWPGAGAIGREIKLGRLKQVSLTVIGVSGNIKHLRLDSEVRPEIYVPMGQRPAQNISILLRTHAGAAQLADTVKSRVQQIDSALPLQYSYSVQDLIRRSTAPARLNTLLVTMFASLALLLAVVGLYGLIAYSVSSQTREIGVRVALGARPADIVTLVVKSGMVLVVAGLFGGIALSFALTRYLGSILYEVSTYDPVVHLSVAAILLATTFAACYLPARRASRLDPLVALRYE